MRQRQPVVLSQEELEQHNDGLFKAMLGDIEMDAEIQALHVVIAYTYDHMRRAHASANRHFQMAVPPQIAIFQMAKIGYIAQSDGHDSGVSLAQWHCSAKRGQQDLHLA